MKNRAKKRPKNKRFEIGQGVPYKTRRHSSSVGRINIREIHKTVTIFGRDTNVLDKKIAKF